MIEESMLVFENNFYYIIYPLSLIIGMALCRSYRKILFVPAIIISIIILNPLFYSIWYKLSEYGYWRILWILPLIPVSATIPAYAIEKIRNSWIKILVVILALSVFILCGSFVYNSERTMFVEAYGPDKLSDDVIEVAEYLLSIDEEPYVVADASLSPYLRQYSGKIKALYSRDVVFTGANSDLAKTVYNNLSSSEGDLNKIALLMLNNDYKYLITKNVNNNIDDTLTDAGFEYIYQVNDYGIYIVTGNRTEIRTYNDFHQITQITNVDENGNKTNNGYGYSTVYYEYNDKGMNILRYYFDKDDNPVSIGSGYFHEYLKKLKPQIEQKKVTVIISVRDEASEDMTETIAVDLLNLGLKTDLRGKYQNSYYAIISSDSVIEEVSSQALEYDALINGQAVHIISSGYRVGNYSSIIIHGKEYSHNEIGLNIVVLNNDNNEVIDSFAINTHRNPMVVYR